MNDTQHVLISEKDRVMTIAWNRPEKKNALTQAMYGQAADAMAAATEDKNIRAVVLTGTQDCFTSGNDVGDFLNNPADGPDAPVMRFLNGVFAFEKPLLAAVNGPVVGVGSTMLLHCDLIVAADTTVFALPFTKLGLCPEAGSSYLLPLLCGYQRAAELLLLGENFDAQTAKECGLVNRIATAANFQQVAMELALRLAKLPPESIRETKALMKKPHRDMLKAMTTEEFALFGDMLNGAEAREAMTAFMERQAPDFSKF